MNEKYLMNAGMSIAVILLSFCLIVAGYFIGLNKTTSLRQEKEAISRDLVQSEKTIRDLEDTLRECSRRLNDYENYIEISPSEEMTEEMIAELRRTASLIRLKNPGSGRLAGDGDESISIELSAVSYRGMQRPPAAMLTIDCFGEIEKIEIEKGSSAEINGVRFTILSLSSEFAEIAVN